MAETETKVDIPQPMEIEQKVEKPDDKAPEVPEKSSKKSKKSKKYVLFRNYSHHYPIREKRSRKNRSRSRSDSESTGESKSRERKASRSKSKSRSRSSTRKSHRRSKKEKRSKKHRRSHSSESRSNSSRSRSKSHSPRRRKHRRDSSYERRRRDRNNRSRDRHDDRRRRNDREHRTPRDRRRKSGSRSRSPHPLLRGAVSSHQEPSVRNKIGKDFPRIGFNCFLIADANKSEMFWDGFQWVAKANRTGNVDPAVLAQTKKMRRLVISNLPLTLGIGENEVGDFVTKFIVENYLNDEGNFHPVKEVTIDTAKNSATIELSSVEEANKLAKVEAIKILGSNCRVAKVGDPKLNSTVGNLITDAQYSGQAAAAALVALTMLSNKVTDQSFTLSKVNVLSKDFLNEKV